MDEGSQPTMAKPHGSDTAQGFLNSIAMHICTSAGSRKVCLKIMCQRESRVEATLQIYEMGFLMTWTSSDCGMGFIIIFGKILGGEGLLCLMLVCTNFRTPDNLKFLCMTCTLRTMGYI